MKGNVILIIILIFILIVIGLGYIGVKYIKPEETNNISANQTQKSNNINEENDISKNNSQENNNMKNTNSQSKNQGDIKDNCSVASGEKMNLIIVRKNNDDKFKKVYTLKEPLGQKIRELYEKNTM